MKKLGKVTSQEEIAAKDSKKLARKGPQKAFSTLDPPPKKTILPKFFFQNSILRPSRVFNSQARGFQLSGAIFPYGNLPEFISPDR